MNICSGGHQWEIEFGQGERKGISHCVDKNVWNKKAEGIVGKNKRTEGLAQKSKMRPCIAQHVVPCRQVEEVNCWWMKVDVEAFLLRVRSTPLERGSRQYLNF